MACEKGYHGMCCCECGFQLKISVCKCVKCSKVEGYICIAGHRVDDSYLCYYKTEKHGTCEIFYQRPGTKMVPRNKKLEVSKCDRSYIS